MLDLAFDRKYSIRKKLINKTKNNVKCIELSDASEIVSQNASWYSSISIPKRIIF